MFETAFLFVAGYLLTWPALVILLLAGIFFEHTGSRKMAVFSGIVAAVSAYFYFGIPLETIGFYALAYLVIGVVWSFWRYKVFINKQVSYLEQRTWRNQAHKIEAVTQLAPSNNLGQITAWIIVWPFSLVENTLGDVINAVQALVTKVFKGVYYKMFTSRTAALLAREDDIVEVR